MMAESKAGEESFEAMAMRVAADCIAEDWEPCMQYGYYRNMNVLEYARRLRDAWASAEAVPVAWMVHTPVGEFDFMVFTDVHEAQNCAIEQEPEGEVIPLYAHPPPIAPGSVSEVEALRSDIQALCAQINALKPFGGRAQSFDRQLSAFTLQELSK